MSGNNKIQVYLDDATAGKIKNEAKEIGTSISKHAAKILTKHADGDATKSKFELRVQALLYRILSSVYDEEVSKSNSQAVKNLLGELDKQIADKLAVADQSV